VARGTIKITIEMSGAHTDVQMPRNLLVRDAAELARSASEEEREEEDKEEDDEDGSDDELSDLDEERED
jgi:hypothetical protein